LKTLCDEGEETLKAASALLKENPDKDKEKEVKNLQDRFKKIRKNM
jgi:vacuolar-type H+-ATPase subunit E/Vma4